MRRRADVTPVAARDITLSSLRRTDQYILLGRIIKDSSVMGPTRIETYPHKFLPPESIKLRQVLTTLSLSNKMDLSILLA